MGILFFLVLPLPFRIRQKICNVYYKIFANSTVKTVVAMSSAIIGMLFVDSFRRSQYTVVLHHHQKRHTGGDLYEEYENENFAHAPPEITPIEVLASRAYHQRNTYISGFILFFGVCIATIMTINKKLVKYQSLINENKKPGKTDPKGEKDSQEILDLKEQLRLKEITLQGLKKQVGNVESHYDNEINKPSATSPSQKKNE
ncbi:hypothetical protein TBLA_0G01950 [Henningerozyma blattae CBS 6284]|uniref:BAP29/BAP31 transmembrane domain-containing protein n=1 Tax=Henningerozyma blattae (strain ATCC 34711 / CBS 6284 / DSM 70876 / NBRC 10599 / NRRL Y-10934 / UCD 77-7) TaxID=1071380 RepID=I2H6Y5_HENB6|nr:hypothetical protein TBLA_0G01950 [Tetrapisispora blattae CBS 6284]CCH62137.1 hypothetical protein TBLA_0G01950 [Tetrapisispora blattae CBS 6284]